MRLLVSHVPLINPSVWGLRDSSRWILRVSELCLRELLAVELVWLFFSNYPQQDDLVIGICLSCVCLMQSFLEGSHNQFALDTGYHTPPSLVISVQCWIRREKSWLLYPHRCIKWSCLCAGVLKWWCLWATSCGNHGDALSIGDVMNKEVQGYLNHGSKLAF